jgi:hypothetical protein
MLRAINSQVVANAKGRTAFAVTSPAIPQPKCVRDIMKKFVAAGFALSMFVAGAASALPIYNQSTKFFDENGVLVGQRENTCNNKQTHGGNVHTAYYIEEAILCDGAGGQSPPTPNYIVPGTLITRYVLPASLNITVACSIAQCEDPTAPMISLLENQGWTWSFGPG